MSRGISEIVATLMIITIVSGISLSIYVYSLGYFTGTASAFGEIVKMNTNTLRERFAVVDVIIRSSTEGTEVSAAVYNYGKTEITLRTMFLNGTELNVGGPKEILPSEVAWFNGSMSIALVNGSICSLRVVSELGNFYETTVVY
ncbi:MAG: hypothetical protein QXU75_00735 [Candidatus Methanomethylicaceae archaeon]